jgi:hypothetical protein
MPLWEVLKQVQAAYNKPNERKTILGTLLARLTREMEEQEAYLEAQEEARQAVGF